jgi:hypothetical protein
LIDIVLSISSYIIDLRQKEGALLDFFAWWYGDNFKRTQKIARYFLIKIWDNFSIGLLLKSLFAPWKQDVISSRGQPINIVFRIFMMNIFSRFVGFIVRSLVILIGLLISLGIAILAGAGLGIYFVVPFLPMGLFIYGIILMV